MKIRSCAFTLIEILIAMAILLVVIVSTIAIFRTSATSWQKGEMRAVRYQEARFILERLDREISSIMPWSLAGPYCLGTAGSFHFVCSAADSSSSVIELGYWLSTETSELMRSYQSTYDNDFTTFDSEEPLSENVTALSFQYYNADTWQDDWDSRPQGAQSGLTPRAVKIDFDLRDRESGRSESFSTVVTIAAAAK